MTRALVVSPHPDDESIGCGGTLRKHVLEGDEVRVIFLTSGENGGHGRLPEETATLREAEARLAAAILGIENIEFWREPDGSFQAAAPVVTRFMETLLEWKPDIVYLPHPLDGHADHLAACEMVKKAIRNGGRAAPKLLGYEVWTPMQGMDEIVDISAFLETKLKAIRAYETQCSVLRFDEAMAGLARYRGEMHSWPGGDYAEVFVEVQA
jgi:LmbE family N-acetylglucosaminyl deacetylase